MTNLDERLARLHPALRETFVALPSDPNAPLTPEQIAAVFPHPEVWSDMLDVTRKILRQKQHEEEANV